MAEEEIAGEGVEGFEWKNVSSFFSKIEGKLGQRVTRRPRAGSRDIDARRHSERLLAVSMMLFDGLYRNSMIFSQYLMNFI